jgi:hypothetical protein
MSVAKLAKSQKDRKMAAFTDSCAEPFFDRKGRPFWFLWGIIVGTGLAAELTRLHTLLVH